MNKLYGKWEVIRDIGSGGQGTVYVAKDTEKSGGTERRLEEIKNSIITDLSTFGSAFRGVRRESGLLTGFFGERRG